MRTGQLLIVSSLMLATMTVRASGYLKNTVVYLCIPDENDLVCGTAIDQMKKAGFNVIEIRGKDISPPKLKEKLSAQLGNIPPDYPVPVFVVGHGFMENGRHWLWMPEDPLVPYEGEKTHELFDTQKVIDTIHEVFSSDQAKRLGLKGPSVFVRSCECGSLVRSTSEKVGCSVTGTEGSTNVVEDELANLLTHPSEFDRIDSNADHILDAQEIRQHIKNKFGQTIHSTRLSIKLGTESDSLSKIEEKRNFFRSLLESKTRDWGEAFVKHREWIEFTLSIPNPPGKPWQEKVTFDSRKQLNAWLEGKTFPLFLESLYRAKAKPIPSSLPGYRDVSVIHSDYMGSITVVETAAALKAQGGRHPFDGIPPEVGHLYSYDQNPQFGGIVLYSPTQPPIRSSPDAAPEKRDAHGSQSTGS